MSDNSIADYRYYLLVRFFVDKRITTPCVRCVIVTRSFTEHHFYCIIVYFLLLTIRLVFLSNEVAIDVVLNILIVLTEHDNMGWFDNIPALLNSHSNSFYIGTHIYNVS